MLDVKLFNSPEKSTWCPGCGDFGILNAVKQALAMLEIYPHECIIVSGIGCGSKLPHYIRANGFNILHGRALPVAQGLKLANHDLNVIVTTGDGDGYGIGMGHLVHSMRRNLDIVHIVEDNQTYGLTKGQYSPTSDKGYITTTSPDGAIEQAVNPMTLAIAAGATFIARGFASEPKHLAKLIAEGIQHKGYALIDVLQPCVTYNKVNTNAWYKSHVYHLDEDPGYDPTNRFMAFERAHEWAEKIPVGVLYRDETRPTYEAQVPELAAGPLVKQPLDGHGPEVWEKIKQEFV
ncbi:MAG TPA: 2-oxoacid:ferredoxin oxidoreductase subunit beta [Chloroflexota bacterium]|nr:2-oxoacid:ferredoxin oxidoreductase subunit beta [Chloroflexota bacterium]